MMQTTRMITKRMMCRLCSPHFICPDLVKKADRTYHYNEFRYGDGIRLSVNDPFGHLAPDLHLTTTDRLFIKDEYQYIRITISDIDFIKSDGNYVEIHLEGKKKVIKETLKNFKLKLRYFPFFQVHRSYIVNVKKIERIGGGFLEINRIKVPIIKQKRDELLELLNVQE